jgi:DNA-binding transcriptional MocR family regulator
LRDAWPFDAEDLTVVDGALDALDRLLAVLVGFGDRVVVENPTFPGLLDLLDHRGAQAVPVGLDERGPVPHQLERALSCDPVAVFLQPRAQNPTGAGLTWRRASELATVLRGRPEVTVVEDDHCGHVARGPDVSLGRYLPHRTVRIRGYSLSHGPDLRVAALAGPTELIRAVERRRRLGPGRTSGLLQAVLLDVLQDDDVAAQVRQAREVYSLRRASLRQALRRRGVRCPAADGLNLWVPVDNEAEALVALAASGIRVSPGSAFVTTPLDGDHVRVTAGLLRGGAEEVDEVAGHLAAAAAVRGS